MTKGLVREIRGLKETKLRARLIRPLTPSARRRRVPRFAPQFFDEIRVRVVQTLLAVGLQQDSINLSVSFQLSPDVLVLHDIADNVYRNVSRLRFLLEAAAEEEID